MKRLYALIDHSSAIVSLTLFVLCGVIWAWSHQVPIERFFRFRGKDCRVVFAGAAVSIDNGRQLKRLQDLREKYFVVDTKCEELRRATANFANLKRRFNQPHSRNELSAEKFDDENHLEAIEGLYVSVTPS